MNRFFVQKPVRRTQTFTLKHLHSKHSPFNLQPKTKNVAIIALLKAVVDNVA